MEQVLVTLRNILENEGRGKEGVKGKERKVLEDEKDKVADFSAIFFANYIALLSYLQFNSGL